MRTNRQERRRHEVILRAGPTRPLSFHTAIHVAVAGRIATNEVFEDGQPIGAASLLKISTIAVIRWRCLPGAVGSEPGYIPLAHNNQPFMIGICQGQTELSCPHLPREALVRHSFPNRPARGLIA
jgi:hypothetical protein